MEMEYVGRKSRFPSIYVMYDENADKYIKSNTKGWVFDLKIQN